MAGKALTVTFLGDTTNLEKAADKVSAKLSSVGKMAGKAALAAGAAAGVGISAALVNAINVQGANAKLAGQLGLTAKESKRFGKIAGDLYGEAWGDSLGTVNEALRRVTQDIGGTATASTQSLKDISRGVLVVADVFDQDLGGVTRAVGQMMRTGLAPNAKAALDTITRGMQQGGDKAGDLLDTVNEYGTLFREVGLTGQSAMGLITQGLQAGARDADKVADAIKEFSIRAKDGSKLTAEGFTAIGLNAGEMGRKIAQGGDVAAGALDLTLDRLRGMEDPVKRDAAAVALFGTQAEDLGDALFALDPSEAAAKLGNFAGATDRAAAAQDTAANRIEAFKRQAITLATNVIGGQLLPKVSELAAFLSRNLKPTLDTVVRVFRENRTAIGAVAAVLAGAAAAFLALKVVTTVIAWVTKMRAAIILLNAAMRANPIGIIITLLGALAAGLVYAYRNSETFRNIVDGALRAVGVAGRWLWNNALKPVFDALAPAFQAVGREATWLWTNAIGPAFRGIGAVIGWWWNNIVKPIFGLYVAYIRNVVIPVVLFLWHNVIAPAFRAIGSIISFWWHNVALPVFKGLISFIRTVIAPTVTWLWRNVIAPAFNSIGSIIRGAWTNVIRPAFDGLRRGLRFVRDAFTNTVNWVRDNWRKIGGFAKRPIQFVVDVVYNRGIRPVWNGIARVFGLGKLPEVRLAGGGVIPGFAPGRDTVPALLSRGEGVLVPEAVRALGPDFVHAANRTFSGGRARSDGTEMFAHGGIAGIFTNPGKAVRHLFEGVLGDARRIPGGGMFRDALAKIPRMVVDAVIKKVKGLFTGGGGIGGARGPGGWQWQMAVLRRQFPGLQLISGFRPGAITATGNRSYHSRGRAVDVPPRMDVFNWIRSVFGAATRELIFSPAGGRQVWNGRPHVYTGITRANHWDHVHWAYGDGGIVKQATPALLGENGPEAVVPLTRPRRAAAVMEQAGLGGDKHYHLTVYNAANNEIDLRAQFRRMELLEGV